jgi:glycosyltransferase involved in cell wall biosynthesis
MKICAHTIVKNEDRYLWFAVKSVIAYVDELLLWDTGSSDSTLKIITSLIQEYPDKIKHKRFEQVDNMDFTKLRNDMLKESDCDWIFILDGDEVWWNTSIKSIKETIDLKGNDLDTIVSPFVNPVGDIYHYRNPSYGKYTIGNQTGDITIRCINNKIKGLHVAKPYGNEGYYDGNGVLVQDLDRTRCLFINEPYMHFTYVQRSSLSDDLTMQRKGKYKHEFGKKLPLDYFYPEVFFIDRPKIIISPWINRNLSYEAISTFQLIPKLAKRILHI